MSRDAEERASSNEAALRRDARWERAVLWLLLWPAILLVGVFLLLPVGWFFLLPSCRSRSSVSSTTPE